MRRILSIITLSAILIVSAFLLVACSSPMNGNKNPGSSSSKGSLTISFGNHINARSLQPTIDMNPASYSVTGTGPGGASFTDTSTGAAVTENSLAFGTWTIVVNATNAAGNLIGSGTSTAQVNTGSTTTVSITVTPIVGTGTLSLGVTWPTAQVQTPSIVASLTPGLGAAQNLPFTISGGTASYSNTSVGNGYYTLAFTLQDTGIVVAGAVDVVRIVTGQTTSGTYAFSNVNAPGGTIQVNVNANLQNPLAVAITGAQATQAAGTTQALTASVSNYTGNVVYVWYVNGVSATTGSTFSFGTGINAGYYRIDVTAFTADGTQAGSATTNVQVTPGVSGTIIYNANGATSGTAPIDPTKYTSGQTVTVLGNTGNMVNPGYNFAGWTTCNSAAATGSSYATGATFTLASSAVTLYAVWIPTTETFNVSAYYIAITGFSTKPLGVFTIPTGVTSVGGYALENCTGLTSITIPASVTSIGVGAFTNCAGLTSISIPSGVTSIDDLAFEDCTGLTSFTIPSSVTMIGDGVFIGCLSLSSISVSQNNPNFSSLSGVLYDKAAAAILAVPGALSGSFTIPSSVTSIGNYAFYTCQSLTNIAIPMSVTAIGDGAFGDCKFTGIVIPSSVTSIGENAFVSCYQLISITIPSSVTTIQDGAFSGCTALISIEIPANVTAISADTFSGCTSLTGITIPSNVTSIGEDAFESCTGLTSLTLPSSVTSISDYAFPDCQSLSSIIMQSTVPPALSTASGGNQFYDEATGFQIHVPSGSLAAYQAAAGWSAYASEIVSP